MTDGFLQLFASAVRSEPRRLFARFEGAPISFATLDRQSSTLAAALRRRRIVGGERVAVMLRNSPATLATILGLAKAGIVFVPVNARALGEGLRYVLEHCSPSLVIAEADLVPTIGACGAELPGVPLLSNGEAEGGELLQSLLDEEMRFDEPAPDGDDCLAICYTSGTTGEPKGVMLSHAMLRHAGEAVALVSAARDGDTMLMWEPLYHIGGLQMIVLPLLRKVTLAMVERFSAGGFWQQARSYGASHIHFLGGILQILLKQPPSALDRRHGARIAWGGGCPADIWRPFEERFGVEIRECYGMTEASSITTYNESGPVGSVGKPVPWLQVELRDADDRPVPTGQRGEIVVHAEDPSALFAGYFRQPAATQRARRGGSLYTGDLGQFDGDGNLFFLGRLSDSVRCRGENVSAWEVERVAAMHPAVEDSAMIGVAAEVGEQEIKLFLQPKPGATIDPEALSAWLGERLAAYQNPRYIAVVEGFERTPSERIMKHRLSRDIRSCWDRLSADGFASSRRSSG